MGASFARAKQYADAKPHLQEAVDREPGRAEAHYLLAVSRSETGDRAGAEPAFKKALELDPTFDAAAERLAAIYLSEPPRPDRAVVLLQGLVERQPERSHLHAELGRAFGMKGDVDRASKHYETSLAKDERVVVRIAYGSLLVDHQRRARGVEQLTKALEHTGDDASMLAELGRSFERAEAHGECVRALDRALRLKPNDAHLHVRRGDCRSAMQDRTGARADYEAAVAADASSAEGQLRLGTSLLGDRSRRTEAVAALELAARLDPEGRVGREATKALARTGRR